MKLFKPLKTPPFPGKRLTTLTQLDEALCLAADARKVSEKNFLDQLGMFWLDLQPADADPWSASYKNHWLTVYEHLAGRPYDVGNEDFTFDIEYYAKHPYPFCTRDYHIVSRQLIGIGSIIEAIALPPGSSILEMGVGWGNTALFLAQMGYDVTVVDINERYGALIDKRAKALSVNITFECMAFNDAIDLNRKFDCVLFFESFHHALDHIDLLDMIPDLLSPGGCLALAGEPIKKNIPFDWGINPAGEALWQIRTHGWFELIFKESYLLSTLERKNFSIRKYEAPGSIIGNTLVCHR